MTYPGGSAPASGGWVLGSVGTAQGLNESSIQAIIRGQALSPWANARAVFQTDGRQTIGQNAEVSRLDNRIDMIIGNGQGIQLATYSTSDIWYRPKGLVKLVVNIIPAASSGGRNNRPGGGGLGGYSGPWERIEILDMATVPETVAVTIGAGGAAASGADGPGSAGGATSFGSFISAPGGLPSEFQASASGQGFRVRGGDGGAYDQAWGGINQAATAGGAGSFAPGGAAGANAASLGSNTNGENGQSITEYGQIGFGSGGGGGGIGNRKDGGNGGWPGGPGGGGGEQAGLGAQSGWGGIGGSAAIFVQAYVEDPYGVAPSTPTGLTVVATTYTSVLLRWTASTDDVLVGRYEIVNPSGVALAHTSAIEGVVTGLSAEETYTFRVRAVDLGGNKSPLSDPVTFVAAPNE